MEMKRASVAMFFAILAAALLTHSDCRPLSNNSGMKSVTVSEQNDLTKMKSKHSPKPYVHYCHAPYAM